MNSFQFKVGTIELLPYCQNLRELFIENQIQNAGEMSDGVAAYLQSQRDGSLLAKISDGKLHIQLVYTINNQEPIGFCITSLSSDSIGEVEATASKNRTLSICLIAGLFQIILLKLLRK